MSSDQELAQEISRQVQRLAAQLDEHQRDLQAKRVADAQPLVQSARQSIERLLGELRSISGS